MTLGFPYLRGPAGGPELVQRGGRIRPQTRENGARSRKRRRPRVASDAQILRGGGGGAAGRGNSPEADKDTKAMTVRMRSGPFWHLAGHGVLGLGPGLAACLVRGN